MPSVFDERDFPVVRVQVIGESTDADVEERLGFLDQQLARGGVIALIFDARRSRPLTAKHRRMWREWLEKNERTVKSCGAGAAILVSSAAVRGVFTALFWMWKPIIPCAFVATDEEAESFVETALERAKERLVGEGA
jgi:hypothetical protein